MVTGEIVIYPTRMDETAFDVTRQNQTLWLTQRGMNDLLDKNYRITPE
jgi:hypothetical protein